MTRGASFTSKAQIHYVFDVPFKDGGGEEVGKIRTFDNAGKDILHDLARSSNGIVAFSNQEFPPLGTRKYPVISDWQATDL